LTNAINHLSLIKKINQLNISDDYINISNENLNEYFDINNSTSCLSYNNRCKSNEKIINEQDDENFKDNSDCMNSLNFFIQLTNNNK
jgi:hypothetical protein